MNAFKSPTIATLDEDTLDGTDSSLPPAVHIGPCNQSKRTKGLASGDCLPGAYNVKQRAQGEIPSWGQQHDDDNHDHDNDTLSQELSPPRDCLSEGTDSHNVEPSHDCSIVDAKLTELPDNQLLIQGVKVTSQWHRRLYLCVGGSLALAILATLVAIGATKLLTKSRSQSLSNHSKQTIMPPPLNTTTNSTLFVTSISQKQGNLSWTIADDMANDEGLSLTSFAGGRLFLDLVNNTDLNFTFFGIQKNANILDGVDPSLISKLVSPLWSGHAVCISNVDILSKV